MAMYNTVLCFLREFCKYLYIFVHQTLTTANANLVELDLNVFYWLILSKGNMQKNCLTSSQNIDDLVNDHLRLDRTSRAAALNKEGKFNFTTCQEIFPSSGNT